MEKIGQGILRSFEQFFKIKLQMWRPTDVDELKGGERQLTLRIFLSWLPLQRRCIDFIRVSMSY